MRRGQAFKLVDDLADAGFSCQLAIGFTRGEGERCSVHMPSVRLDIERVRRLVEIGERHGARPLLDGREIVFLEGS